jgi:membrane protein YfhO
LVVTPHGPDWGALGFVGIPGLIFVFAGFLRRSAPIIFASVLGFISLGMILGLRPLFILFRFALPYSGALRPYDAYYLLCFAMAVLAAFGMSQIGRRFSQPDLRRRLWLGFSFALIAVECLQLVLFAWNTNPMHPAQAQWLFPETPLITNLKALQGEFHVLPVAFRDPSGNYTPPIFPGKVDVIFDLRSGGGYESLLPISTAILWRTVEKGGVVTEDMPLAYKPYFNHDQLPVALLEKLSIGFIATPPNTQPRDVDGTDPVASGALQLVYQGPDGWIYKLPHALPRAFLVPSVLAMPDSKATLRMLVDRNFDARRSAIVIGENAAAQTGLPTLASSSSELAAQATILRDRLNEVEVEVETPQAAMMVLNDSWDDGWNARVDGAQQPVLKVNYNFRGVVVPAGKHRVLFLYRPKLVLIGLGISAVTMLLLFGAGGWIGACWLRRLRRQDNKASR